MSRLSIVTLKVLTGVLLLSNIFAEEEHIVPGTRAISQSEWAQVQESRQLEEENSEALEEGDSLLSTPEAVFEAGIAFTGHEGAFHRPILVSLFGDSVELEDGSIWTVTSDDAYKTLNWLVSDLVVITPNHNWLSSYMFRITNQNTGVSIRCNLTLGPIYNGLYTHWVVAINYLTSEVCLEDGSIWKISGFDSSVFNKWLLNDTIIIGVNDGFLSGSKPNILINVNTLSYARANTY